MKFLTILVVILFSGALRAQLEIAPDTLLYAQKSGGTIDTFDLWLNPSPTTFDGGRTLTGAQAFSVDRLYNDITNYRLNKAGSYQRLRYSSLPHLGFAYSFGSQGTQMLHARYTQAFRSNILLNLDYDRSTGTGFLRNGSFSRDFVRLQLQRMGQRYSFQVKGRFQSFEVDHPDGITTDTLLNEFGLEFTPVIRAASSSTKIAQISLQNFINTTSDSLNHFGLVTKHTYDIIHRDYLESSFDSLPGYSLYNFDSLQTKDAWNHPSIDNGAGIYFLNRTTNFYLDATVHHRYWNAWDLGELRDTNEIAVQSKLSFEWKGVQLKNSVYFNLIGGFNGWEEKASASFQKKKLRVAGDFLISSMPADPIQRFYFANNYDYELSTVNRQVFVKAGGKLSYDIKDSTFAVGSKVAYFSLPSAYIFDGDSWELSDSLGSAISLQLFGHVSWKFMHWRPSAVVSVDNGGYLPTFQAYSRLYVKGRLFKAKRLEITAGTDLSFYNSHSLRTYVPAMDAFQREGQTGTSPGLFNAHAFISLGIEQFRFYARFENMGYLWNDKTIEIGNNYPIAGTRVRVGITWEFFN